MSPLVTLKQCVNECYSNDEFVKEFNRLNNASLKNDKGFYNLIDVSTGKNKDDLLAFVRLVDVTVYMELMKPIMKDIENFSIEPTLPNLQKVKNRYVN